MFARDRPRVYLCGAFSMCDDENDGFYESLPFLMFEQRNEVAIHWTFSFSLCSLLLLHKT